MFDKYLSEHEMTLQDFIITCLERIKIASIIYGVSKIKGKGLGYSEICFIKKAQLLKKHPQTLLLLEVLKQS